MLYILCQFFYNNKKYFDITYNNNIKMFYQNIKSTIFKISHNFCYVDIVYISTISTLYFRNIRNIKI